ncbi:hypothetical protein BKA56DRAFT_731124 [Ilyonectria sp. MPI-CAGE-AT-0026]|nr:hypothetical protein BKA56DRAFT_731124 [Ilyonectria sp. MPI-CAGE-AT-0026]
MTDAHETLEPKVPTVAASANECLESFQQCLLRASSIHPRELSMVEDQVARFSTWATGIGVFAPERASMDHRLRYAPEVQGVVAGLLESLNYRIRTCSDVLCALGNSPATNARSVTNERLERSFVDIATEISRLNKISNTIRSASKEAQIIKASDFQIIDDGNNVEPLLLGHFEHYIGDRFPNISESIQKRLARAMLLRRKRILHRRSRQGNTAIRPQKAVPEASITLPAAQPTVPSAEGNPKQDNGQIAAVAATIIAPSQIKSATTLAPNKFKIASSSPSIVSASKTVALANHEALVFPPAPGLAAKRKYEKLKSQRVADYCHEIELEEINSDGAEKLGELLKSDVQAIGEITCPYCLYALPAQEMFDERKWHNHVKNDLDPYVCLFEDCDQPDLIYNHSDEWLNHLHQHAKVWRCSSHRELGSFSTREEYIIHMRVAHITKLSDTQLRFLANRNTRKTGKLFPTCPLCGQDETEVDGRVEDHIAGHLRSLALKSLPSYLEEITDDSGSAYDSGNTSRPQSRSTIKNLRDDDMLGFGGDRFWDHWNPQPTDTKPPNFPVDVHFELDSSSKDIWTVSWDFDELASQKWLETLEDDDPILEPMLQRKQDRAKGIDERKRNSSDLPADEELGDVLATSQNLDVKNDAAKDEGGSDDNHTDVPSIHDGDIEKIAEGSWLDSPASSVPTRDITSHPLPQQVMPTSKKYQCPMCYLDNNAVGFGRQSDFKRHLYNFHSSNTTWLCKSKGCHLSFTTERAYSTHAREMHRMNALPNSTAKTELCPQVVFGCGFANCKDRVFEAKNSDQASNSRDKYFEHICKHYEDGFIVTDWGYKIQLHNLMRQSQVKPIWKTCIWPKERRTQLIWCPRSSGDLKRMLEARHLGDDITTIVRLAFILGTSPFTNPNTPPPSEIDLQFPLPIRSECLMHIASSAEGSEPEAESSNGSVNLSTSGATTLE